MKTVYVETSIFSYLAARPSANLLAAARQRETLDWWELSRPRFALYVSPLVEEEAARGDVDAAARRLEAMKDLPSLEITSEVVELATFLLKKGALPDTAGDDAAHVALAAVHRMDYLLTLNCRHIDNAEMKPIIRSSCEAFGVPCPEICTPGELMGGPYYE
jgi:predicted nucleic acid-binding protein